MSKTYLNYILGFKTASRLEYILFYLLIFSLPIQIGYHFWPAFTQVLGIRIDYLSLIVYGTDILVLILFLLCILNNRVFLLSLIAKPQPGFRFYYLLGVLAVLIVSILYSAIPQEGWYTLLKFFEFLFFGWYVSRSVTNKKTFRSVVFVLLFASVLQSILAMGQFFHQGSLGGLLYWIGERTFNTQTPGIARANIQGVLILRPYGTLPHPNVLAGVLLVSSMYSASLFSSKYKWVVGAAFILCSVALFLTLSRLAILLWFGFALFYGVKLLWNKKGFDQWMIILGGIVIFSVFFILPAWSRITSFSLSEESVVVREQLALSSIQMIRDYPFFGVGLGNVLINLPTYNPPHSSVFLLQPVHSIYLYWFAETGLFGLFFGLIFLINTFLRGVSYMKKNRVRQSIFFALCAVLILGCFDHYFLTLQQGALLFALVLGMIWTPTFSSNGKQ